MTTEAEHNAKVIRAAVTAGYVDRVPTLEPDGLITDGLRLTVKGRDALALLMLVCPKDELEVLARAAVPLIGEMEAEAGRLLEVLRQLESSVLKPIGVG